MHPAELSFPLPLIKQRSLPSKLELIPSFANCNIQMAIRLFNQLSALQMGYFGTGIEMQKRNKNHYLVLYICYSKYVKSVNTHIY